MHVKRLRKLAELLERPLPKDAPKFDMYVWYECGTRACAASHACLDPWFQRRGLRLHPVYKTPSYRGSQDTILSLANFFDIDPMDTDYLFTPHGRDNSRRTVARRIRRFIKDNQ